FDLSMYTLKCKTQPFGDGAASCVVDPAVYLNAIQPSNVKEVIDQCSAASSDDSLSFKVLVDPVTYRGGAVRGIKVMKTDSTDDLFIDQDYRVKSPILGKLRKRSLDPLFCR